VCHGFLGNAGPAQHACNLVDALARDQRLQGGRGVAARGGLGHYQVLVGMAGDLRQVGDGNDLAAAAQAAQQLTDHGCRGAADAYVHLVENHGRHPGSFRCHHLDGQADPR